MMRIAAEQNSPTAERPLRKELRRSLGRQTGAAFTQSTEPQFQHDLSRIRIVADTAQPVATGRPLDPAVRAASEQRLGYSFDRVRIHTDAGAACTASALGARAVTIGEHIFFGTGQYSPDTTTGRRLVTHELAHVVQQREAPPAGPAQVGLPGDRFERSAEAAAGAAPGVHPLPRATIVPAGPAPAIQCSDVGGLVGGILGGLGLGLLGGLALGPVGLLLGVAGAIGGALLGQALTSRERKLTEDEIKYAKDVFKDSIDYSKITVTRDSLYAVGAPRTIGNTINLKSSWGHFKDDTLELTDKGRETLIHEMGHVWQYQNGDLRYLPSSLIAQIKMGRTGGAGSGSAYDWTIPHKNNVPWEKWNPEQQAEAIEDYNKALRASRAPDAKLKDIMTVIELEPYMQKVWRGEGAPGGPAQRSTPSTSPAPAGSPAGG